MVERSGEASFLQTAEEIWLQSETEVRLEGGGGAEKTEETGR